MLTPHIAPHTARTTQQRTIFSHASYLNATGTVQAEGEQMRMGRGQFNGPPVPLKGMRLSLKNVRPSGDMIVSLPDRTYGFTVARALGHERIGEAVRVEPLLDRPRVERARRQVAGAVGAPGSA